MRKINLKLKNYLSEITVYDISISGIFLALIVVLLSVQIPLPWIPFLKIDFSIVAILYMAFFVKVIFALPIALVSPLLAFLISPLFIDPIGVISLTILNATVYLLYLVISKYFKYGIKDEDKFSLKREVFIATIIILISSIVMALSNQIFILDLYFSQDLSESTTNYSYAAISWGLTFPFTVFKLTLNYLIFIPLLMNSQHLIKQYGIEAKGKLNSNKW